MTSLQTTLVQISGHCFLFSFIHTSSLYSRLIYDKWKDWFCNISCSILSFIVLQEFGDSARARKLYEQESDDDDDDEIEPNPKLEQGKFLYILIISTNFCLFVTSLPDKTGILVAYAVGLGSIVGLLRVH